MALRPKHYKKAAAEGCGMLMSRADLWAAEGSPCPGKTDPRIQCKSNCNKCNLSNPVWAKQEYIRRFPRRYEVWKRSQAPKVSQEELDEQRLQEIKTEIKELKREQRELLIKTGRLIED